MWYNYKQELIHGKKGAELQLEVRLFAGLHKFVQETKSGEPFSVQVPENYTAEELISHLGIPKEDAFVILVNGLAVPREASLKEGDRVGLFPPVGGG